VTTNPPVPDDVPVPDEALDRVRAADPAATAEPDHVRLRAAVAGRAAAAGGTAADGDAHGDAVVSELATARTARTGRTGRRKGAWIQVAAAIVGLSVIGGGSWALGRLGQVPVAAPVTLGSGSTAGGPVAAVAPRGAADSAAGVGTSKLMAPWYGGRTVFTGSGLSTDGGTATAWGFDPASVYSADTVAHLASVLGVSGTPSQGWGAWVVGVQDGTGPTVQLQPDGLASFSYYDPTRDPWACMKSAPDVPSGSGATGSTGAVGGSAGMAVEPAPAAEPAIGSTAPAAPAAEPTLPAATPEPLVPSYPCATSSAAPAPTGDAATAQARDLMSSLGVDAGGYRFEVQADQGQPTATYVTASQILAGQLTGVQWSFTLLADGVQSLYGSLAPVVDLGAYALISPADAVARLGDARFDSGYGGVMPLGTATSGASSSTRSSGVATAEPQVATAAPTPTVPATPSAGESIPWPVQTVTLTASRLGLGMTTLANGAVLLLPSYELSNAEGSTWSVIAVTDDRLDFSPTR
jgi:hypothetical protein